jgi:hypothetical protein
LFKQLPKGKLTGAFVFGSIALVPLVFDLLTNPSTFYASRNFSTTMPDFWANIRRLHKLFWFHKSIYSRSNDTVLWLRFDAYHQARTIETNQNARRNSKLPNFDLDVNPYTYNNFEP